VTLKSQGVTPAMLKSYKEPGFESLSIDEMIVAKVTVTTPALSGQ
jgi:hypothetical protein